MTKSEAVERLNADGISADIVDGVVMADARQIGHKQLSERLRAYGYNQSYGVGCKR